MDKSELKRRYKAMDQTDESIQILAELNNRTANDIRGSLGLPLEPTVEELMERVKALHAKGLCNAQITEALGMKRMRVSSYVKRLGLKHNKEMRMLR